MRPNKGENQLEVVDKHFLKYFEQNFTHVFIYLHRQEGVKQNSLIFGVDVFNNKWSRVGVEIRSRVAIRKAFSISTNILADKFMCDRTEFKGMMKNIRMKRRKNLIFKWKLKQSFGLKRRSKKPRSQTKQWNNVTVNSLSILFVSSRPANTKFVLLPQNDFSHSSSIPACQGTICTNHLRARSFWVSFQWKCTAWW